MKTVSQSRLKFLSTPSARRATYNTEAVKLLLKEFLSTPSARRATIDAFGFSCRYVISIHALREEGDILWDNFKHFMGISIHALREEGDSKNREKIPAFIPL